MCRYAASSTSKGCAASDIYVLVLSLVFLSYVFALLSQFSSFAALHIFDMKNSGFAYCPAQDLTKVSRDCCFHVVVRVSFLKGKLDRSYQLLVEAGSERVSEHVDQEPEVLVATARKH